MPETEGDLDKLPRFPYVAALLCAACVGAAAWTWMRYSFAWRATYRDFWTVEQASREKAEHGERWVTGPDGKSSYHYVNPEILGRYVRVTGRIKIALPLGICYLRTGPDAGSRIVVVPFERFRSERVRKGTTMTVQGRAVLIPLGVAVNTEAGRITGATVAGLVVGVMGCFVFRHALRHWVRTRRDLRQRELLRARSEMLDGLAGPDRE